MNAFDFIKPNKVVLSEQKEDYGRYEFYPLEPGFGLTVGNMLRRVLLSSLYGYAITRIKIEGTRHEFSTIEGVVEDVTEMVLNLKKIRFKSKNDEVTSEILKVVFKGEGEHTAKEIHKKLSDFEIQNQDQKIFTASKNIKVEMEIEVGKGRGYTTSDENKAMSDSDDLGWTYLDSTFSPILNVKYDVEDFRVEQKTDYEKLIFELFTDGTIDANDAIKEAATTLIDHLLLFSHKEIVPELKAESKIDHFDEKTTKMKQLLSKDLMDFDLSVRAINCLRSSNIQTLGDIVSHKKSSLMRFRNFGKKSLVEIETLLDSKGLSLGMDVSEILGTEKQNS